MKNLIFILLLLTFSFANESNDTNNNDFDNEFDSEFSTNNEEIFDPLSGYNRIMTTFNDKTFIYVLNPISKGYAYVTPEPIRIGINNFFENIMFPVRLTNNLLQLKFQNSAEELGRFLVNTLWGLAGFLDPATNELHMDAHKEDFGQTLGFYGVGEGFHVVLPFLGPSNLRDIAGLVGDAFVSPLTITGDGDMQYKIPNTFEQQMAIQAVNAVNSNSLKLGQYESLKKDALDLYPFLRDIYTQARKKQIEE
ncbi:MlaA family lipoprotein [Arcobacter caeni]|uniref:ABC transporter n=1 Tax=Arcobacter caeni TaxID=1912877 RepID=A0A363D5Z6_9BACT|nr:VacJ family lipoprotein [Arcobacter caeni]PUE66527.1 ABC transporter [Arcobacter caeni]